MRTCETDAANLLLDLISEAPKSSYIIQHLVILLPIHCNAVSFSPSRAHVLARLRLIFLSPSFLLSATLDLH